MADLAGYPLLLAGLALDAVLTAAPGAVDRLDRLGRPLRGLWAELARRLDRPRRGEATLTRRGLLLVLAVGAAAAAAGWAVHRAAAHSEAGWAIELLLIALLLGQRDVFNGLLSVRRALERQGLAAGRAEFAARFGGNAEAADLHGVVRVACAAGAGRFAAHVVTPVFWYAALGLAGLCASAALLGLAGIAAPPRAPRTAFGRPAALARALLLWLPARLAALLLVPASVFVPGASPGRAAATLRRDGARQPDGWPVAALAGGLGLALGGPRSGGGDVWIGDGRARAEPGDLGRAVYLLAIGSLLLAGAVAALGLWLDARLG